MITNFHTHTYRCMHAQGTEEDYVKAAINQGVQILGFSDHAPFPDHDFGLRMKYDDLDDYLNELERLNNVYGDKIKILKGLEIEYHPKYLSYYKELVENRGLDYLALGEHTYINSHGIMNNIFFADSTKDYVSYANAVCEAIKTGLFAFVAHPDIMFINDFDLDDNCEKACNMIIDCAEKNDMILEFNANGLRRNKRMYPDGVRYPYPHKTFWEKVSGRNIRVLIGSDNHQPEQVNDSYVQLAREMAKDLELNVIETI